MDDTERERGPELVIHYVATTKPNGAHHLRIEVEDVGAYLFVWETPQSASPEKDYLQDTLEIAKEQAEEDYRVPVSAWREVDRSENDGNWGLDR